MERFINGGLTLRGPSRREGRVLHLVDPQVRAANVSASFTTLSIDLETDGWDGPILSIALAGCGREEVFVVRAGTSRPGIQFCPDERTALEAAFALIAELDPDLLLGWNVVEFDLRVLEARCTALGLPLAIGRAREVGRVLAGSSGSISIARIPAGWCSTGWRH